MSERVERPYPLCACDEFYYEGSHPEDCPVRSCIDKLRERVEMLEAENAEARGLLWAARGTIHDLAGQQDMPDDFYLATLGRTDAFLVKETP